MSLQADKLLGYIRDSHLKDIETRLLEGKVPGETAEQRAINYSAYVMTRKRLIQINNAIKEYLGGDPESDDALQEMPEESAQEQAS